MEGLDRRLTITPTLTKVNNYIQKLFVKNKV